MRVPVNLKEVKQITEIIDKNFSGHLVEELARKTGFVERKSSTLTGQMFLMMNVFDWDDPSSISLNDSCAWLKDNFGVQLKKQSLDERINASAVRFMQECLKTLFEQKLHCPLPDQISERFSSIKLTDATAWQLPKELADVYPSNGGDTTGASIKTHLTYDLLSGQTQELVITAGKANDARYFKYSSLDVQPKDLIIRDMGYFKAEAFAQIHEAGAYFLSCYKTGVNIYRNDEQVNIEELLPASGHSAEYDQIFLTKKKIPVRLCILPVSEKIRKRRLKELKAKAKNKGWKVSQEKKLLCGYNLFITNVSKEQLPVEWIQMFYRLRWQIELIFKNWKSILKIDKVKKMNVHRFECMLYGRLIAILLSEQIRVPLKKHWLHEQKHELSDWKALKLFKKKLQD